MPRLREPPGERQQNLTISSSAGPVIGNLDDVKLEVIKEDEPVIEVAAAEPEAAKEDDATIALKKQVEASQKSEQLWKDKFLREREENLQRARERDAELTRSRRESEDNQEVAISATLIAAKASLAKAEQDIQNARDLGDRAAEVQAETARVVAINDMRDAERGKDAVEERKKQVQPQQQQLPQSAQDYISQHPEIMSDRKMNRKARFGHEEAVDDGIKAYSPEYFAFMDKYLGFKEEPVTETPAPKPQPKGPIVSAPVSREVPTVNGGRPSGKVVLTRDEQEAAAVAGVTLEEYAKQKLLYQKMRADGTYGDQR